VRLLDLFSAAGGAAAGYSRAGWDVTGVDILPQPEYPFPFIQADAIAYAREHGHEYDAIHASPPCQPFTRAAHVMRAQGGRTSEPDLLDPTRDVLEAIGRPWIIENVVGAPLRDPLMLCGSMFGLKVRRHRLFESSAPLMAPGPCRHKEQGKPVGLYGSMGDTVQGIDRATGRHVIGGRTAATIEEAQDAIGIDWTRRWASLKLAIPPAYTEWIGRQLIG